MFYISFPALHQPQPDAQREVIAYHSEFWTTPFQWIDGALKWKGNVTIKFLISCGLDFM